MAEVQVEMLADPDTKEQIKKQILTWEENLERLHCEQFRLKCYMASLQNGELPNPKVLAILKNDCTVNFSYDFNSLRFF